MLFYSTGTLLAGSAARMSGCACQNAPEWHARESGGQVDEILSKTQFDAAIASAFSSIIRINVKRPIIKAPALKDGLVLS
jgi:hypothetical protein